MTSVVCADAWLEIAWREVKQSRRARDEAHLPKSVKGGYQQPPDAKCPSDEPFGVCCPCVERNPSSKMVPVTGISVIVVPTELISNMAEELLAILDLKHPKLPWELWVQATATKGTIRKAPWRKPELVEQVTLESLRAPEERVKSLQQEVTESMAKDKCPPNNMKGIIVLTAWQAYNKQMRDTKIHALPCGRYIRDEFHKQQGLTTIAMTDARELILRPGFDRRLASITLASGTPNPKGPQDWQCAMSLALISLMESASTNHNALDSQVKDPFWKQFTPKGLKRIAEVWNKTKPGTKGEEYSNEAEQARAAYGELITAVQIGRGRGTKWHDRLIMEEPRSQWRLIQVEIAPKDREIEDIMTKPMPLDRKGVSTDKTAACVRMKKCGSFPYLATLFDQRVVNLGKDEMDKNAWLKPRSQKLLRTRGEAGKVDKRNPYIQYNGELTKNNAKVAQLQALLVDQLRREDWCGRPAKGIIFVESNEAGCILQEVSHARSRLTHASTFQNKCWHVSTYLHIYWPESNMRQWFRINTINDKKVTSRFVYGSMNSIERQALVREFQEADDPKILIGVSNAIGTGVTLTRAIFCVLFEQNSDPGIWTQMPARMCRYTNWNWAGVVIFEFIAKDSYEKTVRDKRLGRMERAKQADEAIQKRLKNQDEDDEDDEDDETLG
jgi:hypothetical protein